MTGLDLLSETLNNIKNITGWDLEIEISENYGETKRKTTINEELENIRKEN